MEPLPAPTPTPRPPLPAPPWQALSGFTGCALVVSHDRYFLDRLATHLLVFHGPAAGGDSPPGRVEWFEGNWSDYVAEAARRGGAAAAIVAAASTGSKRAPPALGGGSGGGGA